MQVKVQLVIGADDGESDTIHDVAVLEKDCHQIEEAIKFSGIMQRAQVPLLGILDTSGGRRSLTPG